MSQEKSVSKSKTRLYNIWKMMRKRCRCENRSDYKYYGGKGIKVCEEWDNIEYGFEVFQFWAMRNGYNENLTIDRINPYGNYCPENCRWVTMQVQAYNRGNTKNPQNAPKNSRIKTLSYKGQTKTIGEWAKEVGIDHHVLRKRLKDGWSVEKTLETPVDISFSKRKKADDN